MLFSTKVSERCFPIALSGNLGRLDLRKARRFSSDVESVNIAGEIIIKTYSLIGFIGDLEMMIWMKTGIGGYSQSVSVYSSSGESSRVEFFRIASNGLGFNMVRGIKIIGSDGFVPITSFSIDEVVRHVESLEKTMKIEIMRSSFHGGI